jgi:hypothetical protein
VPGRGLAPVIPSALPPLSVDSITAEWLAKLAGRLDGVLSRLKRVHFKSPGSLLACQEKLAGEWQGGPAGQEGQPTALPVEG